MVWASFSTGPSPAAQAGLSAGYRLHLLSPSPEHAVQNWHTPLLGNCSCVALPPASLQSCASCARGIPFMAQASFSTGPSPVSPSPEHKKTLPGQGFPITLRSLLQASEVTTLTNLRFGIPRCLNSTLPSLRANSVWSRPTPTFSPA